MRLTVRLFGTLGQGLPGYDPALGISVTLPEGARVTDLLDRLGLPPGKAPVVVAGSRLLKGEDTLSEGAPLHVLQPVHGG